MTKAIAMCFYSGHREIFESPQSQEDVERAQVTCATCPSQVTCLNVAEKNKMNTGIWGGIFFGRLPDAIPAG